MPISSLMPYVTLVRDFSPVVFPLYIDVRRSLALASDRIHSEAYGNTHYHPSALLDRQSQISGAP